MLCCCQSITGLQCLFVLMVKIILTRSVGFRSGEREGPVNGIDAFIIQELPKHSGHNRSEDFIPVPNSSQDTVGYMTFVSLLTVLAAWVERQVCYNTTGSPSGADDAGVHCLFDLMTFVVKCFDFDRCFIISV
ncbi:hypothetical protein F2P81_002201 [Scophthalmus maximus]|uniref:Uncharacterized protein n=1 Tax=Scophthalmus maximus TaxID=52904 RepID=A0A6A4TUJ4_SCOMX|nr:hypothetical protein F2P81_002201 [Scophthalmus maximus]